MAAHSGRRALLCSLRKFLGQQGLKRISITHKSSSSSLSVRSFRSAAGGRMLAKRRVGVSYTRSKDAIKAGSESDGYVKGGTSSQNGAAGEIPKVSNQQDCPIQVRSLFVSEGLRTNALYALVSVALPLLWCILVHSRTRVQANLPHLFSRD